MPRHQTMTGIAASEVEDTVRRLRLQGATVQKHQAPDGTWTITATLDGPPADSVASSRTATAPATGVPAGRGVPEGMIFPMRRRPDQDYRTGARHFGADRDEGRRKHAGCDLIAPAGTEVLAMADGEVIEGPYSFHSGTDAIEVRHDDGTVVRYCEIAGTLPPGVRKGARVSRGQVIAQVGQLDSGSSMLHLEMYRGTETGNLTERPARPGDDFQRRADLMDPTPILDEAPVLA